MGGCVGVCVCIYLSGRLDRETDRRHRCSTDDIDVQQLAVLVNENSLLLYYFTLPLSAAKREREKRDLPLDLLL